MVIASSVVVFSSILIMPEPNKFPLVTSISKHGKTGLPFFVEFCKIERHFTGTICNSKGIESQFVGWGWALRRVRK
jgi:hypothetical protein